jgi:hypothetical protein
MGKGICTCTEFDFHFCPVHDPICQTRKREEHVRMRRSVGSGPAGPDRSSTVENVEVAPKEDQKKVKGSKPPLKDWQLGEFRVKVEIITPDGSKFDAYIPHLAKQFGVDLLLLTVKAAASERVHGVDWNAFYVTTYCNRPHRVRDGMPINHECYVLPRAALLAEMDGDMEEAQQLLQKWAKGTRYTNKGIKG